MKERSIGEIVSVILVGAVLVGAAVAMIVMNLGGLSVRSEVTVEAGSEEISPSLFLKDSSLQAVFCNDISALSFSKPGQYEVELEVSGRRHKSKLVVVDTVAPTATANPREIAPSQTLEAKDLVKDIKDATKVTATFKEKPSFGTEGTYLVTVVLTDASGNVAEVESKLTVTRVRTVTEIDAYRKGVTAASFLLGFDQSATLLTNVETLIAQGLGDYPIQLQTAGRVYNVTMRVTDLTPPKATKHKVITWDDTQSVDPMKFVSNIVDVSEVTASYVTEPVYGVLGEQSITVRLTDAKGNTADFESVLSIVADTKPPVITGVADREVFMGETVSYKKGVSATDDKDGEVAVTIDSSAVNINKVGTYPVYITAQDAAGNKAEVTQNIVVTEAPKITEELVKAEANKIIKNIIREGMTKPQKAEAVYNWVSRHLAYIDAFDDTDWLSAAYHGLTARRGDCYQYYATTKVLLDACGIENMKVTRVKEASTKHFWLLVNVGSGWYHMDTTPHHIRSPFRCFMKTDKEIWDYAAKRVDKRTDYYDFDTELYPPRATVPYAE